MPGGGLVQLIAYGAQDIYLSSDRNFHSNAYANHEYYHAICKRERKQKNIITHKTKQYGNPRQLKRGITCIISLDEIAKNENYTLCNTCKQIFSWGHITLWLQNHNTCPHCRTNLEIGNLKKYINSSESKKEKQILK